MEKNLFLDFKPHDEISETLSMSPRSLNYIPFDDSSPSNVHSANSIESDSKSKKIRKKRNAYQKIDDETRLHLLEAVQNGETLKSAAKRYQVNYSSAKSIFHIYRKEGRILKKATQDRPYEFDFPVQPGVDRGYYNQYNPNSTVSSSAYQVPVHQQQYGHFQQNPNYTAEENTGCPSPLTGLVDNFNDLLKIGNNDRFQEDMLKNNKSYTTIFPSRFQPRPSYGDNNMFQRAPIQSQMPMSMQQNTQAQPNTPTQPNMMTYSDPTVQPNLMMQQNVLEQPNNTTPNEIHMQMQPNQQMNHGYSPSNPPLVSPANAMKHTDDFYMNYSNSPLSGNAKMIREGSESGSNRNLQGEFESFSEMMSAFQKPNHLTESLKDLSIPKLVLPNTQSSTQERPDFIRKSTEEEINWNGSIETAALDTYKSFIDAQMVLSNAFKKATLFNNMVQVQRLNMDESPDARGSERTDS